MPENVYQNVAAAARIIYGGSVTENMDSWIDENNKALNEIQNEEIDQSLHYWRKNWKIDRKIKFEKDFEIFIIKN